MYNFFLVIHSGVRWLVLASLIVAMYNSFAGWLTRRPFTRKDVVIQKAAVSISHLQFTIGVILYIVSPIARYFLANFPESVHMRDIRFFGLEHITMMIIAVALITAGHAKAKQRTSDISKFRTLAIWYSIALLIIFLSIPWPFSPFTARPYFRF